MKRVLILLPLLVLSFGGCWSQTSKEKGPAELRRFESAQQLKDYLADQVRRNRTAFRWRMLAGDAMPMSEDGTGAPAAGENGTDFSGTNVQEAGVDESDVVKTDGTYFYLLRGDQLKIVKAVPADEMDVVAALDLDLGGTSLYLADDKAVILAEQAYYWEGPMPLEGGVRGGAAAGGSTAPESPAPRASADAPVASDEVAPAVWPPFGGSSFDVNVVNVANPESPALVKKYSFEGGLVNSRMIGTKLFLVVATYPNLPDEPTPTTIQAMDVEDILPTYRVEAGEAQVVEPLVGWADVYHPVNPDGYTIVNVVTIDLANLDAEPAVSSVMADWGVIYASPQALYITNTAYDPTGATRENTEVHKFDLSGAAAQYVASGKFEGRLLNQFSLGENDGFLRVATTTGFWGGGWPFGADEELQNHVFVLEQAGDQLNVVGQIDGIAVGETLYAARFAGDRGFLVTFRQIDPLFTVDLADPRNPMIVGELEVPGFSNYIHLLDADHLLTVGRDVDAASGAGGGVTLSIFDVTDPAAPALLHRETIGDWGTDSEALWNHKAFTFHDDLLALPISGYVYNERAPYYGHSYGGVNVYRVSIENGFKLLGSIETFDGSADDPYWYWNSWTRGIFIGENVYAATDQLVKSAAVADVGTILSTVEFE